MSIEKVLGTILERGVSGAIGERRKIRGVAIRTLRMKLDSIRECDAVRAVSLSAHSEDVDESGMIKMTKWDGEEQDRICFAK